MEKKTWNKDWTFFDDIRKTEPVCVTLPHDAMLGEKRLPGMKNGAAAGFYPGGRYVYTKKFYGEESFQGKAVYLEFEGIYMKSSVYLNKEHIGGHVYGYTGFYVDLTDKIRIGEENEIRVIADNSQTPNSRWYTGSGIYRDVQLYVGNKRHILPEDGVCIKTLSVNPAILQVDTKTTGGAQTEQIHVEVCEYKNGSVGACVASGTGESCRITVPDAKLWDENHPNLYQVRVILSENGEPVDEQSIITGIRTLTWSAQKGLQINGKGVKLRGGCIHHDNGMLGACAHRKAEYRKARILKENGFNAVRSAHNPISKALLDACDEMGLYVMDEAFDQWKMKKTDYDYALYFDEEWEKDITAMLFKDRNHPSVIMYSIGNEIADTGSEQGPKISKMLTGLCHKIDPTRPTTNGINPVVSNMGGAMNGSKTSKDDVVDPYEETAGAQATASLLANMIATAAPFVSKMMGKPPKVEKLLKPCFDEVDVVGYNYAEGCYEPHHVNDPERLMVGTETYPQQLAQRWPLIMKQPYILGDFMWTAVDYLGEAGVGVPIYGKKHGGFNRPYPCVSGGCGVINLIGEPEAECFHASAVWGQNRKPYIGVRPVNHTGEKYFFGMWRGTDAVSSWTWPGMENRSAEVEIYSTGTYIELFQDGVSLGRRKLENAMAKYRLTYKPGLLRAINYDSHGTKIDESEIHTANGKMIFTILPEEKRLHADGEDMTYISISLTDTDGIPYMLKDCKVTVTVNGAAELIGIASGNPVTDESFTGESYTTWFGKMGCFIRSNGKKGTAIVEVSAEGLETKTAEIEFV